MTTKERLQSYPHHDSMRGVFGFELYKAMSQNPDIYLLVGDLGYGVFDSHFTDFPQKCFNVGAAEQTLLDVAVGLAYQGKIPICYSITPFLLYRGFETIRTYINRENLAVKLIGSGRDLDYAHDGYSHDARDVRKILTTSFPLLEQFWPDRKQDIPGIVEQLVRNGMPSFLSLQR